MSKPTEHKSVQARILKYAQEIGWKYVPQSQAEQCRGFDPSGASPRDKAKNASRFFTDTLFEKVRDFNPKFKDTKEELLRKLNLPLPTIAGNRDFLHHLQGEKTFFSKEENREFNLVLINYEEPGKNVYEVTEEYYLFNGQYANREDVVFLINGIPVLVIECKNATKDEAIALGIDQIRRYHRETPEFFSPEQIFTATESIGFSYGVTWNINKRNIFNWKEEEIGNLEAKVKSFCDKLNILDYLQKLLKNDYRGIIVSMMHKFRDMPADVNLRKNIYVLIDEAHRTTGGDLGTYLMAADLKLPADEIRRRVGDAKQKLFAAREKRVHPGKDGRLYHRYREGEPAVMAFLDDHAFLTWGLIELYEATFEVSYLKAALEITDKMMEHFRDKEKHGLDFALGPISEVVIAGDAGAEDTKAMLDALGGSSYPVRWLSFNLVRTQGS